MSVSANVLAKGNRIEVKRLAKATFAPAGASPYTVAFEKLQVLETVRFSAGEIVRLKLSGKFDDRLSHSF